MTSFYGGGAPSTGGSGSTPIKGALIFKGTLGISDDGATVLVLPDEHEEGWTYLVVTAGTYAGQLCEKGDFVICVSSGETASDLDWTVVQGNIFSTLPTPTALDEGKIIAVDALGNYVLIDNPSSGGGTTENLPDPSEADEGKFLSVGADGNYTLTDNPANDKLDKDNGTATGTTTFDKVQANRLELLVNGESIGGFRSIDLTPAVTDNGDDSSMRFVPLFIGEPTKDFHAATKKYVDDKAGNYLPLAGGTMTGSIDAGENTVTNLKEPEEGADATTKNYVDGEVAKAAPVSIMPIPEVSGEKLIQVKDSVEWPLQGMRVYGKSTQVTTTGAQLIDTQAWQTADSEYYKITEDGGMIQLKGDSRALGRVPTFLELEAGYYTTSVNTGFVLQIIKDGVQLVSTVGGSSNTFTLDGPATIGMKVYENPTTDNYPSPVAYPMINAGSTVKPWEPYTGGKPSPSPEYPQPIVSAGDGGSIEATITGKNLLTGRLYYGKYNADFASIQNEDEVSLPYKPTSEDEGIAQIASVKKGKTYTFSVTNPNTNVRLLLALYKTFEDTSDYTRAISKVQSVSTISITPSEDGILVCLIAGTWTDGTTTIHECTASELLQLEVGSTATAYEAPHSQSIVATTPAGLPGIPVTSGGNFVDADGQEWICNYRDWARGVDVKNVVALVYNSDDEDSIGLYWNGQREDQLSYGCVCFSVFYNRGFQILPTSSLMCSHFPVNGYVTSGIAGEPGVTAAANRLYFRILLSTIGATASDDDSTILQAIRNWFNTQLILGAPVTAIVKITSPIESPIPADELAAYRALHTYDGTTIISTDEDISGLKVKYVAKAIDYQQSINVAIQETNDKIDAVYNSLVKKAESVDEVNQLFKDWWNANWEEGSSTYNDMLERWFGKVLDDDKVYGVKLPLFETSTSPQGEYIEDSVGAIVTPATEEDPGQNDFAKTPQFWCVEVAAEKKADGSHTIYACEFIDDTNVVRNGGPDNRKHLVWVLQKNTYVREYEESGYSYIKIQCHPTDGFVQWPQGTDRTGHTYSYIANPKYAAGIDDEGNIGCRTGLKPTCYMSMNETIQAWRARGPQYSGSSACFYKWAYIMYALLTAKKGEDVGCNSYNYQYAAAVSESGVSRIILTADQVNNLYVGSNIIIGNTEGNNDRNQAAMYSLVKLRKISSIEEVNIEEDVSSYKAVYIDVPDGTTFDTTAGTTYISTMPFYSGWTDNVKGTIGTKYNTNLNRQPFLLQKVELMNGAYNYASDELDQWSQQDDTHYLYSFYLCEDQTKVSTNGTITDDYMKKENATLTIDTTVYTTNNSWYYIEDNLTDNNFKMLNPKKFSISAGSGTGTRDAFYLSQAASEVRTPIVWAYLWSGGSAGLSCRDSSNGPSWTVWSSAGGCPGLSG